MDDFYHAQHAELFQSYKSGANWFYWIAGLSLVTSLISLAGGAWRFLISLGSTQLIDAFAEGLSEGLGGATKVIALVLDIFITAVFILFGVLAGKKYLVAYLIGMIVFLLDGLVPLAFEDWVGVIAHVVVLFFLGRGLMVGRQLLALEKEMAEAERQEQARQAQAQATV